MSDALRNSDLSEVVERDSLKVSGAWVFLGTRVPVVALFENLKDGASVEEFLEWFPGVTRTQVEKLLNTVPTSRSNGNDTYSLS